MISFKEFNAEVFTNELLDIMDDLPEVTQLMLNEALKYAKNDRDMYHIMEWLLQPNIWRMPKVSLDTFIDDPYYLGIGNQVYPKVRDICREIVEGGYREAVEIAGIGAGKSFSSEVIACYQAHHLLCLNKPHKFYGLTDDKAIAIMNMGVNATQALEVVFTGIKSFIQASPFFLQFMPSIMSGTIRFEAQKILLTSGNSKATTPLGYNVFSAILDEAAFFLDNDSKSVAQEIYESLQRRVVSRFGKDGLVVMISSPRYTEDFIMKKLKEANELTAGGKRKYPHIYTIRLPTWKVKGIARADITDKFFFDNRKAIILDKPESEVIADGHKINYIDTPEFDESFDVWEIPGEYKSSFQQNPEKAKRDFGATPSEVLSGFFTNPAIINDIWNNARENPLKGPGEYKFRERPERTNYYIHIDIGFNRNGVGDHTGFAMGHFGGWIYDEVTKEHRMKFVIDVAERIGIIGKTGEIDLADVRRRIYDLKAHGFNIALVTFDQFASKDFRQTIEKKGFKTDYLSVDKNTGPYDILKEAIYENRFDCFFDETLSRELKQLELINGIKVDHPPYGSKDLSDAVAGVCHNIFEHTPKNSISMGTAIDISKYPMKIQQHLEQKRIEKDYAMKKRIADRQTELMNRLGL